MYVCNSYILLINKGKLIILFNLFKSFKNSNFNDIYVCMYIGYMCSFDSLFS